MNAPQRIIESREALALFGIVAVVLALVATGVQAAAGNTVVAVFFAVIAALNAFSVGRQFREIEEADR